MTTSNSSTGTAAVINLPARRSARPRPQRPTGPANVLAFGPREKPVAVMVERFRERTVCEGEAARDVGRVWPVIAGVDLSGLQIRDGHGEGEIRISVYADGTAKVRAIGNVTAGLVGQAAMTVRLIRAGLEMGVFAG